MDPRRVAWRHTARDRVYPAPARPYFHIAPLVEDMARIPALGMGQDVRAQLHLAVLWLHVPFCGMVSERLVPCPVHHRHAAPEPWADGACMGLIHIPAERSSVALTVVAVVHPLARRASPPVFQFTRPDPWRHLAADVACHALARLQAPLAGYPVPAGHQSFERAVLYPLDCRAHDPDWMGEAVDSGMRGVCGCGRVRTAGRWLYAAHERHCRAHAAGRGEGFVQRVPAGFGASRHARAGDGGNGALDFGLPRRRVSADAPGEHGRERGRLFESLATHLVAAFSVSASAMSR